MRPLLVVVSRVLFHDMIELALIDHDEVLQRLVLHRLRPALGKCIEIRSPHRQLNNLGPLRFKDCIELGGEFGVPVPNDMDFT